MKKDAFTGINLPSLPNYTKHFCGAVSLSVLLLLAGVITTFYGVGDLRLSDESHNNTNAKLMMMIGGIIALVASVAAFTAAKSCFRYSAYRDAIEDRILLERERTTSPTERSLAQEVSAQEVSISPSRSPTNQTQSPSFFQRCLGAGKSSGKNDEKSNEPTVTIEMNDRTTHEHARSHSMASGITLS